MIGNHGNRHHGALSDRELDALLATASDELLTYVRRWTNPTTALLAIMAADNIHEPNAATADENTDVFLAREHAGDHALAAIEMRALAAAFDYVLDENCARSLTHASYRAHDLDHAYDPALDLVLRRARTLAHELIHTLTYAVDHAFNPALGGAFDDTLTQARNLGDALEEATSIITALLDSLPPPHGLSLTRICTAAEAIALDLTEARDNVQQLTRSIVRAGNLAGRLDHAVGGRINSIRQLRSGQVDVSGTDLSRGNFSDLKVLEGVIWTPRTIWPAGLVANLLPLSAEIGPGVYQVRGGSERDRLGLAIA